MMPEISLNILDVAENSIRAQASLVEIEVDVQPAQDILAVTIRDNGRGMTAEEAAHAEDPFFTTRTTRKVGLGIPFFRQAAVESGLKDQKSNLSFSDCSGTEDRRKKIPIFQKDSDTVLLFLCHYDIIFMKK